MPKISKAFAISNAKISFVSLVDKAANLKTFLIAKAKDGKANFQTFSKIIEKNAEKHYLTGIVYEPNTEDAHGNYMTAEEIKKAADWYAENGNNVDIQHSFKPTDGARVVKSWIAEAGEVIGGIEIKEGTWLMKMEITDENIWKAIENGEITGFSMGGVGDYSTVDEDISKAKKLFKSLGEFFGLSIVEKGEVADRYAETNRGELFWNAWYSLQQTLSHYNSFSNKTEFENDEETIREALSEFSEIVTDLLAENSVTKAIAPTAELLKAGKKISSGNRAKLQTIYDNLGKLLADTADPKGDEDEMKMEDIEKMFDEKLDKRLGALEDNITKITKALGADDDGGEGGTPPGTPGEGQKGGVQGTPGNEGEVTVESISKMMDEKLDKFEQKVNDKLSKATGVSLNLNNEPMKKSESSQHYMHGFI